MRFRCLSCRKRINVEVHEARRRVICPRCDTKYWIPGQADVSAGATAEAASPINRRPTPLVDMLPRPSFLSRKPMLESKLEPKTELNPQRGLQPTQPQQSVVLERKPVSTLVKWGNSLTALEDKPPVESASKPRLQTEREPAKTVVVRPSRAPMVLTSLALAAVLLTIGYFVNQVANEPDKEPPTMDQFVVEEEWEPASPIVPAQQTESMPAKEPVEFAELLHRDAEPQEPVKSQ